MSLTTLLTIIIIEVAVILTIIHVIVVSTESKKSAVQSVESLLAEVTEKNINKINLVLEPISNYAFVTSIRFAGPNDIDNEEKIKGHLNFFTKLLDTNPNIFSSYVGFDDGHFYMVIATRGNKQLLEIYKTPQNTMYIDRTILKQKGSLIQRWRYFDKDLNFLSQKIDTQFDYDPRKRPWYKLALEQQNPVFTPPYIFSSSRLPGITCAKVLSNNAGVVGIDFSLAQLSELLSRQRVSDTGFLWVIDNSGRLVSFPGVKWEEQIKGELKLPDAKQSTNQIIRSIAEKLDSGEIKVTNKPFFIDIGEKEYLATLTKTTQKGLDIIIALTVPYDEIPGYITVMNARNIILSLISLIFIIPLAVFLSRRATNPISQIIEETDKIQKFDFSESKPIISNIKEVQRLIHAINVTKSTIKKNTDDLIDAQNKLEMLLKASLSLSAEKNIARLITLIFEFAKELSNANGGVLYLKDKDILEVELISIQSGSIVLGGLSENPVPRVMINPKMMPFLSQNTVLYWACNAFNKHDVVFCNTQQSLFPTGLKEEPTDYIINNSINVPITNAQGQILGIMQLFNSIQKGTNELTSEYDIETIKFLKSLASQAGISLYNRNLIKSLNDLFNALIQVIATSIDAKSQYTSGHCERVPKISLMIAEALHDSQDEKFKDFNMDSEEKWDELRIASWLHDCGKVISAEYVVDKATKLETIYNRIHEIRTRFEVIRRDLEIEYYKSLLQSGDDIEALNEELQRNIKKLEEDFAFVASCNIGVEFMSDEHKERLKKIAELTWKRHFSDRLGISNEEMALKNKEPEPSLPVNENLLSDKPEHIIPRTRPYADLTDINGNPIKVPKYEFNRGELYNLMINRGTLTEEERFKINEHVIMTYEMLSKIPFPEQLSKVIDIASSHHETLVGTGYPFKKSQEHLSVQSRILAIADIFEALTSRDRPYRKAKTLSEALKILTFMIKDGHIDADIFDIFLKSGACMKYAEQYLLPEQIDVTDISVFLSKKNSP